MAEDLLLGIDVGTSSVKALVCEPTGRVVARGSRAYPTAHPLAGRSEQNPDDWWDAMAAAVRAAASLPGVDPDSIAALAVTTQGGTLVPADADGVPTRPAVVWSDVRCPTERTLVADAVGDAYVYRTTGWFLGTNLNLLQTIWLRRNEPDVFRATRRFLSVPDYLAQRLTGRPALDVSNAGVNQLADYRTGAWDETLTGLAGIDPGRLGEIVPAGAVIGDLLPAAADALGLRPGIAVANGGHDQYCAALGAGVVSPGDTLIGTGTAWVVAVVTSAPQPDFTNGHCVSRHVLDGRFGALTSLESGGAAIDWWRGLLAGDGRMLAWEELERGLPTEPEGAPLFLPYLHGTTYPRALHQARGVLWGLDAGHDRFDIAGAVMAGVAFQTAWMLQSFAGVAARRIVLTGGAAKSRRWTQLMADILDAPIRAAAEPDAGAVGAALLAGAGIGSVDLAAPPRGSEVRLVSPGAAADRWQHQAAHYRQVATDLLDLDPKKVWTPS